MGSEQIENGGSKGVVNAKAARLDKTGVKDHGDAKSRIIELL
jgi:hypothetical protein